MPHLMASVSTAEHIARVMARSPAPSPLCAHTVPACIWSCCTATASRGGAFNVIQSLDYDAEMLQ